MKYPLHNPFGFALLYTTDILLKTFLPKRISNVSKPPRSLLICNGGHLGDVILTTALLTPLKKAYPNLFIGMAVGSWAKEVVQSHPLVDAIHLIDHWKLNRSKQNTYLSTRRQALKEIRSARYESAIDCRFHFPNMAPLLWQAKIPLRSGFATAGLSPFLTHTHPWDPKEDRPAMHAFFALLEHFPDVKRFTKDLHPTLCLLPQEKEDYIVCHPGSGDPRREWSLEKWRSLAMKLTDEGYSLYFTGRGERERTNIETICEGLKNCINLADQLGWEQFVLVIQKASLLVGMESAAGHIASAVGTPTVSLYTGMHPLKLWRPSQSDVLSYPVSCSPCLRGCASMHCVKNISVEEVYNRIGEIKRIKKEARPFLA